MKPDIPLAERSDPPVPTFDVALELEQIENALDVMLREIVKERKRRSECARQMCWKAALVDAADIRPWQRREFSPVHDLICDPVNGPRLMSVRLLGRRLGEIVDSFEHLQDIADRVAYRDPENCGRRLSILNSRWDGARTPDGATWRA